jgi:hypothetical protein
MGPIAKLSEEEAAKIFDSADVVRKITAAR